MIGGGVIGGGVIGGGVVGGTLIGWEVVGWEAVDCWLVRYEPWDMLVFHHQYFENKYSENSGVHLLLPEQKESG